jgi:hypothetical protein
VLSPLLFIVYANDVARCLNLTKPILFADDTTVYMSSKNYLMFGIILWGAVYHIHLSQLITMIKRCQSLWKHTIGHIQHQYLNNLTFSN